jgi:hypothetical protein
MVFSEQIAFKLFIIQVLHTPIHPSPEPRMIEYNVFILPQLMALVKG